MADAVTNFSVVSGYFAQDADDRAAVARCLTGDAAAFEVIVERYQRLTGKDAVLESTGQTFATVASERK